MAGMNPNNLNEALTAKRIRRQFEPDDKNWNDEALDTVWEDVEGVSKHTIFAMKNIFFFSHATEVQATSIPVFSQKGNSAIVEAATGSGKTIAFMVPVLERVFAQVNEHVNAEGRPKLHRRIVGVVLSPSKVLCEQTFLVAKNLACRFPFNIRVALCDGIVETPQRVADHLRRVPKNAGTVLVTTPQDLLAFVEALNAKPEEDTKEDDEDHVVVPSEDDVDEDVAGMQLPKLKDRAKLLDLPNENDPDAVVAFGGVNKGDPFQLVVDEADVVMRSDMLRGALDKFIGETFGPVVNSHLEEMAKRPAKKQIESTKKSKTPKKGAKKGSEQEQEGKDMATEVAKLPLIDFGFYGATVNSSKFIKKLVADHCGQQTGEQKNKKDEGKAHPDAAGMALNNDGVADDEDAEDFSDTTAVVLKHNRTTFKHIVLHDDTDFVSELANRYISCPLNTLIASLVHIIDVHPSKKHFIFFNSPTTLLFVHKLLTELTKGKRPLLHVENVYMLHEGMKEEAKFENYNAFLSHKPEKLDKEQAEKQKKKDELEGTRSVHPSHNHKIGRAKRSVAPPKASGAILLCTDIAAYGLDIRDVDYCYHFEPPPTVQSYIHRIGRVGRMGMRGSSLLLLPSHLAQPEHEYFQMIKEACTLQLYRPPPAAPIVSSLRGFIQNACMKEAKRAAMALGGENQKLFSPKQSLQALLLMD